MALLTADDVLNKKFSSVKFREGYDQVEVDEFLDEVVATVYALQVENGELKEKLEASERRIAELSSGAPVYAPAPVVEEPVVVQAPAPVPVAAPAPVVSADPESATSMLALAQRLHDEYVNDGRDEGERIINEAHREAEGILAEVAQKRDAQLRQLEKERELLENKINELRNFEADYRRSLSEHLQKLIQDVTTTGS